MRGKAGLPLFRALKTLDPDVKDEYRFEWLFIPKSFERSETEKKIIENLWADCKQRGKNKFPGKECDYTDIYTRDEKITGVSRRLEFDFFLPKYNLIIELDEIQHFTVERSITFNHYPKEGFYYDCSLWKKLCDNYQKKDSDPLTRDWKRAFRDAVRDLRAKEHNFPLIRLFIKDYDAKAFSGNEPNVMLELKKRIVETTRKHE